MRNTYLKDATVCWILVLGVILLLSGGTFLRKVTSGEPEVPRRGSTDEDFYLALIHEVAEGHVLPGNVSLREHRDDPSITTALVIPPGLLMGILDLKFRTLLLILTTVTSFLLTTFAFYAWRGLCAYRLTAVAATLVSLSVWGAGLLNVINPPLVLLPALLHLALLFGVAQPHSLHFALRGITVGSMLYTYPHYFLFFAALEGCIFLYLFTQGASLKQSATHLFWIAVPLLLTTLPKPIAMLLMDGNRAVEDHWHRLVIPSRFPAAPALQGALLAGVGILSWLRRRNERSWKQQADLLLLCLFTGLIVLNQQLIHGMEIMFGLHYRLLLTMFLWVTALFCLENLLSRYGRIVSCAFLIALSATSLGRGMMHIHKEYERTDAAYTGSDTEAVMQSLHMREGEQIVLAPRAIADLIPIFTQHYVAWSGYAAFQSVTDQELAQRYVLQELVEPQVEEERDRSYPHVFGVHAGNLAARTRTWCRITSFFRKSIEECRVPIRSMIRNQEVLRQLEEDLAQRSPERHLELLQKFNVDIIIADIPLPETITNVCPVEGTMGRYTLFRCGVPGGTAIQENMRAFGREQEERSEAVLVSDGKEIIMHATEKTYIEKGVYGLKFDNFVISPSGRYVLFKGLGWEWSIGFVFDVTTRKIVLELNSPLTFALTPDEQTLYACTADHMGGEFYGIIYTLPEATPAFSLFKNYSYEELFGIPEQFAFIETMKCAFHKERGTIIFTIIASDMNEEPGVRQSHSVTVEYDPRTGTARKLLSEEAGEIALWNTFTNVYRDYAFDYPPQWNAEVNKWNSNNSLFGRNTTSDQGYGGVEVSGFSGTIEEYLSGVEATYTNVREVRVGEIAARQHHYQGVTSGEAVIFKQDGKIYNIYLATQDEEEIHLFDRLVASFRFVK